MRGRRKPRTCPTVKCCPICDEAKSASEFYADRSKHDGLSYRCRDCVRAASARWAKENPERAAENRKRTAASVTPEARREYNRRWAAKNPGHVRALGVLKEQRRRALKRDAFVEDVDPRVVYEMHGGRCGICSGFIDRRAECMHVDHVIPLSRGGAHGYINVQPTHARCNLVKGAKFPEEMAV